MIKKISLAVILLVTLHLGFTGCGPKKVESSTEAIKISKTLKTLKQQINYLNAQIEAFRRAKEYKGAISIGDYVLGNLDGNSQKTKILLEKVMQSAVRDATRDLEKFSKTLNRY